MIEAVLVTEIKVGDTIQLSRKIGKVLKVFAYYDMISFMIELKSRGTQYTEWHFKFEKIWRINPAKVQHEKT